jgi:hypothetical protein
MLPRLLSSLRSTSSVTGSFLSWVRCATSSTVQGLSHVASDHEDVTLSRQTVLSMETSEFLRQRETFGLEQTTSWGLPALRLLFSTPRVYEDLARAWNLHYPGTVKALDKLVAMGFAAYQPGVIVDTTSGELATTASRRVPRYRATASGQRSLGEFREDLRSFEQIFPRTQPRQVRAVVALLEAFELEDSHARFGMSVNHAIDRSGLTPRLARWWFARFLERDWVTLLPERYADVREIVPAHWRVTRPLCRQIETVLDAFPSAPQSLRTEFHLRRSRFLGPIDPVRVGLTGATDFDHDVNAQAVVATLMRSPHYTAAATFSLEPRLSLPIDRSTIPWGFDKEADGTAFYQPDAILPAQDRQGATIVNRRVVVEYERFQSRRDAWAHIERFLGWLHTFTEEYETANLCFVVDSEQRLRTYAQLIAAFADYVLDHPNLAPKNSVVLAAITVAKLRATVDPLNLYEWTSIPLVNSARSDTVHRPVLHDTEHSPYAEYFGS